MTKDIDSNITDNYMSHGEISLDNYFLNFVFKIVFNTFWVISSLLIGWTILYPYANLSQYTYWTHFICMDFYCTYLYAIE